LVGLGTSHSAIIALRSVLRGRTATNPPTGRRRSFLNIPVHSPFGGIELRMIEAYIEDDRRTRADKCGRLLYRFGARLVLCEENLVFGTIPQLPRRREER
jgi:hypothetical protein